MTEITDIPPEQPDGLRARLQQAQEYYKNNQVKCLRMLKFGGAGIIVFATALGLLSHQQLIISSDAVVSAYTTDVRAPISGRLEVAIPSVGTHVKEKMVLGRIINDRAEHMTFLHLQQQLAQVETDLQAYQAENQELTTMYDRLRKRGEDYNKLEAEYIRSEVEQARAEEGQQAAKRALASRDLQRQQQLAQEGWLSGAYLDKYRTQLSTSSHGVSASNERINYLAVKATAAENGFQLDSGSNDTPYSAQRADEVHLRIADITRQIASLTAQKHGLEHEVAEARVEDAQLSDTVLQAPTAGMIWNIRHLGDGRVFQAESLFQIVDDQSLFVLAIVPQNRIDAIREGGVARFRIEGGKKEYTGRVVSVIGDNILSASNQYASFPTTSASGRNGLISIAIHVPQSDAANMIGRTAHVVLPTTDNSIIKRFLTWLW
ncbi:HlyD family secretion protein [Komagataeibacter sp. FXV3]|uniref:HlyD family secretion protein n=1 Tax=Komagataeibacter sp. FXV3 TaxID=2608998 RepID=UPI00187B735D|nr:HlyD family efflux transporter periplasmic adaptor subunit [Komagataeibacter sp. FXV3]